MKLSVVSKVAMIVLSLRNDARQLLCNVYKVNSTGPKTEPSGTP